MSRVNHQSGRVPRKCNSADVFGSFVKRVACPEGTGRASRHYADLASAGFEETDVFSEVERQCNHEKKLSGYSNPLLILHTENDGLIDISHAERHFEWADLEQRQLVRFPAGNHNTIFRSNLSEYLEAVRSFAELVGNGQN